MKSNDSTYVSKHLSLVSELSKVYLSKEFDESLKLIRECHQNGNWVFLGGNGGSQAMIEHFATDWNKGINQLTGQPLKSMVLNSNISLVTAIANDLSYKESLSYNLKNYGTARDLLVLVSSSGTSPNILDAVRVANELKMNSILLSGFGKKTAPANVTVEINVESDDYQVIEDIHTIYGHLVLKAFA